MSNNTSCDLSDIVDYDKLDPILDRIMDSMACHAFKE